MPYTTNTSGTTITASWANANVRDQVVTPFATTSARDSAITSPLEGMVVFITGDDKFTVYSGASWIEFGRLASATSWTPTVSQGVTTGISNTVSEARYVRIGNLVHFWVDVTVTGTGTAGSAITITLPITGSGHSGSIQIGSMLIFDASAATRYQGTAEGGSTTISCAHNLSSTTFVGANPSFALANGDVIRATGHYLVA